MNEHTSICIANYNEIACAPSKTRPLGSSYFQMGPSDFALGRPWSLPGNKKGIFCHDFEALPPCTHFFENRRKPMLF